MSFPYIENKNELISKIAGQQAFGVYEHQVEGATIVCYAISDRDTFAGDNVEWKRECRGITFNQDGQIIARTLHKFHNVGENDKTQPHLIPWDQITRVSTKHDGSMVTPLIISGSGQSRMVMKTKRSFNAKEAVGAMEHLRNDPELFAWCEDQLVRGWTPTFEWVSPDCPIVLTHYRKPELILLQIRDMTTGKYADLTYRPADLPDHVQIAENHIDKFRSPDGKVSWDLFKEQVETLVGEEGWVVQTDDDQFWKVKTAWYMQAHRTCTFLRWRDLLASCRDDQLDDIRGSFTYSGRSHGVIDFVEQFAIKSVDERMVQVNALSQEMVESGMTDKDLAATFRGRPFFTDAMRVRRGADVRERVRADFFRDVLTTWSLAPVDADLMTEWGISYEEAVAIATTPLAGTVEKRPENMIAFDLETQR